MTTQKEEKLWLLSLTDTALEMFREGRVECFIQMTTAVGDTEADAREYAGKKHALGHWDRSVWMCPKYTNCKEY